MSSLNKLLSFIKLTHQSHRVERVARIPGETRYANMVEHSWQLAMLAWYVTDTENLSLDKELVLKYALSHDLVETYAGDTYIYDERHLETKKVREKEALEKISTDHSEFIDLERVMSNYEKKKDKESRFVYALDKTIDPLNIYLEDGLLWREKNMTLEMLLNYKSPKVSKDPTVKRIFEKLVERLKEKESDLF